ncbi:hypothetical protein A1D31_11085 [Bradyrhizobium liaoningense]|nr:hypothetical protein A1D31_11085 [Bradyrhizobium liaoningense]
MRQHGLEPCAMWHDGKFWEGALIDVAQGRAEFFTDWALRGDPDRDLRRAHIAEVWAARPEGARAVMLGDAPAPPAVV